jgi:hypothetical protein
MVSFFEDKVERRYNYSASAFYTFHKILRQHQGRRYLAHNQYITIIADILLSVADALVEHPIEFVAPNRMGRYYLEAIKTRNRKFMDWDQYHKTKEFRRHLVPITRGYSYKMRWYKQKSDRFRGNMRYYKYRPSMNTKLGVRKMYKDIYLRQNDPYRMDFERM